MYFCTPITFANGRQSAQCRVTNLNDFSVVSTYARKSTSASSENALTNVANSFHRRDRLKRFFVSMRQHYDNYERVPRDELTEPCKFCFAQCVEIKKNERKNRKMARTHFISFGQWSEVGVCSLSGALPKVF